MVAFWALQPGSTHWWLYILRPLFFSLPSNTDPICEIQQYPMRISWDEDTVLFKKDNQKGSIAWSPTLPEKVVPGNELGDMPISLDSEIRLEAALEHRCVLNFPASSAGQAEAAQAQTQSKSLWEYRGDKHSEERAVNDEGCVSYGRVFLNPVVADALIQKQILQVEEIIEVVLKQQRMTILRRPAALSWSEMKCSQVILTYTKNTFMPTVEVTLQYFEISEHISIWVAFASVAL